MYISDETIAKEKAEKTKTKREKIVFGDKPYPCKICGIAKHPKEFVVYYIDNYRVGKFRYLYECKVCKKARIYAKRHTDRESITGAIQIIYKQIAQGAKARKIDLQISEDDIMSLREKQNGLCYYTHYTMEYKSIVHKPGKQSEKTKYQVSCDRKDPDRGYIKENIVLCCTLINRMKNILTEKEFYKVCEDIIKQK